MKDEKYIAEILKKHRSNMEGDIVNWYERVYGKDAPKTKLLRDSLKGPINCLTNRIKSLEGK